MRKVCLAKNLTLIEQPLNYAFEIFEFLLTVNLFQNHWEEVGSEWITMSKLRSKLPLGTFIKYLNFLVKQLFFPKALNTQTNEDGKKITLTQLNIEKQFLSGFIPNSLTVNNITLNNMNNLTFLLYYLVSLSKSK